MTRGNTATVVFVLLCTVLLAACGDQGRSSRIIVKKMKIQRLEDGIIKVIYPLASLPKSQKMEGKDVIEGRVVEISYEPDNPSSRMGVALLQGAEMVVLTNIPYVNTLRYLYLNKEVRLVGTWGKQAVIYGKGYKAFWVEDYSLIERKGKQKK